MNDTIQLRLYWHSHIASLIVFTISAIVMVGWLRNSPELTHFYLGQYDMKFSTALGFFGGALALALLGRMRPQAQIASLAGIGLMLALSASSLLQYLPGWEPGLSPALHENMLGFRGESTTRMPAATALGFIMTGLPLAFLQRKAPPAWPMMIIVASLAAWLGVAIAYIYGLTFLYQFESYGGISILTVVCFIVLHCGILFAYPHLGFIRYFTGSRFGGFAARRLIPPALLLPFGFGWLVLWTHDADLLDIRVAAAAEAIATSAIFVLLIGWCSRSLQKLEHMVSIEHHAKLEALQNAARLAHYDVLTNLPNRALLNERLSEALSMARSKGTSGALLFLDLDRFKPINDSYGHQTGDQVLMEVTQRLRTAVGSGDTIARQGGDEFVILLPDVADAGDASRIATELLHAIEQPYRINGNELLLSGSIGISIFPRDGQDGQALMDHADAAMYYAKSLGRRNFQFFAPHINERAMRRSLIERQLRAALADDGFELQYQPKISVQTSMLVGMEALVRLKPVDGKPIPPSEFIPVAEESGLIVHLGEWVLREACRQARAWHDAGYNLVRVSVNISPIQFRDMHFIRQVKAALKDSGLEPRYLDLEITESTAMQNFEHSIAIMRALQALDVSISIDDFGTGYSSLSSLKRFSVDTLKIDRSFIRDLPSDKDDAAITCAIIDMARNLNQKVVAEGVETAQQLAFLKKQGCDQVQGFIFSEPLSAARLAAMYFDTDVDTDVDTGIDTGIDKDMELPARGAQQ